MPSAKAILKYQLDLVERYAADNRETIASLNKQIEREEGNLTENAKTAEDIRYTLEALGEI